MKAMVLFVSSLLLTSTTWANLENEKCASFARGAAESLYVTQSSAIQGHIFQSSVTSYQKNQTADQAEVQIKVVGYDEDRHSWTKNYTVVVNLPVCSIEQIF